MTSAVQSAMLDSKQIQVIRATLHSLIAQYEASCEPAPFDYDLFQESIDEAIRRGYPVDGDHSLRTFLRPGVGYGAIAGGHLDRPTQIWLALYTSSVIYVDEVPTHFPSEIPNIYLFNDRFIGDQQQGNAVLDALADLIRRVPDLFQAIPSKLIMTSTLNFVTANLLEYETKSMQISTAAKQYPIYYREMTGLAEGYAYAAFSREVPWTEYVQAIPEIMLLINDMNDLLSFYKEELVGEDNNQISVIARRDKESHLDTFRALADIAVSHYKKILKILEGSPKAYKEFKRFSSGYIGFHMSLERYKLADLNL